MRKLLSQIIAALLGLWLAVMFVPGVQAKTYPDSHFFGINLTAQWQIFLLLGIVLGLLNFFVKPIVNIVALPLRIITLGFSSLIVDMALLGTIEILFRELYIPLWLPLFYTAFIIWSMNIVVSIFTPNKEPI